MAIDKEPDQRMQNVSSALNERYGGFSNRGLRLELRDPVAELAEMFGIPDAVELTPGQLSFYIVVDEDGPERGDEVGQLYHRAAMLRDELVVVQVQHHIRRPAWRRRGFMSALLEQAEAWYAEAGVQSIVIPAEGDGSLFAARRGFDFDTAHYAGRTRYQGLEEDQLRAAIVTRMMRHPGVFESVEGDNAPRRPSVRALLDHVAASSDGGRALVERFEARISDSAKVSPSDAFTSPAQIEEFERGTPVDALDGEPLGRAVLRHTAWQGIKPISG